MRYVRYRYVSALVILSSIGELAQLGERFAGSEKVKGSIPLFSTILESSLMIKDPADYELLLDCFRVVDNFTRKNSLDYTMKPEEMSSLIVMLDILEPNLKDLH